MLVGPVFLAGSMTSERERQTLDLLLTTTLTPWQILWGKFIVGFRISAVLTSFLLWPLLLGTALNMTFWSNWEAVIAMFVVVILVCLVNASVALTSSLFNEKTSIALLTTYSILLFLYVGPPAAVAVMEILNFSPDSIASMKWTGISSPFSALFAIPLDEFLKQEFDEKPANVGNLKLFFGYILFSLLIVALATAAMLTRLKTRLGVSD